MTARRKWTDEEVKFLETRWGSMSIKNIAARLGRSIPSVKNKAQRLGLIDPRLSFDGITINQLAQAINVSHSQIRRWIKYYDFPAKWKVFASEAKVRVVRYEDFWKWAEQNKQMIDFSRIEPYVLGPEPDWVKAKRDADFIKKRKIKKNNYDPWTEEEDNILKGMLNAYKYTYPEIAQRLNRSEAGIKRRIQELGLKARPVRLNNHVKYTPEEVKLIEELIDKGHCLEDIASRINKSALGVRGKLERMGYKFRNGVPVKEKEIS
ncbi:hypothetical protein C0971_10125 [Bacillus methanolicus]|uniref:hypothetical protein n=1 Tax=Bacillus methanolicus TaxID=1471 RepID=UPI002010BD69|nr:hypothetical protein [Bacillus methanolicus]UQD52329.1 hypothetical protein C0971_10125 [Bacillus methanolicus]